MPDEASEEKKTEVLSRIERLRELIEEDAETAVLERAFDEIRRSLDGLTRPGRGEGDSTARAAPEESPSDLRAKS